MSRILLSRGARGELVKKVQRGLAFSQDDTDGIYGGQTETGVKKFQSDHALEPNGAVDMDTWSGITLLPPPELFERALGITADFEGHGFELIAGNFDKAGLTWGVIGFTLAHGEIPAIVLEMHETRPDLVQFAFAGLTAKLLEVMHAPLSEQLAFADAISIPPKKARVAEPWASSFAAFGRLPEVQQLQLRRAREEYFAPAQATAARLGLTSELGIALCFDTHVQNGRVKKAIEAKLQQTQFASERELRIALANAVADSAKLEHREDVRARKLTLATGAGTVHGAKFHVPSWGLDDLPA